MGSRVVGRIERQRIERQILAGVQEASNDMHNSYLGLSRHSLMLACIKSGGTYRPSVNLVLPSISSGGLFAGVRTAVEVGVALAQIYNRKLRLFSFSGPSLKEDIAALSNMLSSDFHLRDSDWELVPAVAINSSRVHEDDVWIATYWTTAHALDIRCRLGRLAPSNVIYLIQDYEPSFLPASTDAFIATSTYRAGFIPLVNSSPLASALHRHVGLNVDPQQVFAPQLDLRRLEASSRQRSENGIRREVLFYGRPSKPRNMFNLGVSALRSLTHADRAASEWSFSSMGERHRPIQLANGAHLRPLGPLSWSGYFERIAEAPILLSLQASPHPSHPPLDMVVSGGMAVTNEVDCTRAGLHQNLLVGNADPDELSERLRHLIRTYTVGSGVHPYDPDFVNQLGIPLTQALEVLAEATKG